MFSNNNAAREVIYIFLWLIGIIFMYALLHICVLEPSSSDEKNQMKIVNSTISNQNTEVKEKVTPRNQKLIDTRVHNKLDLQAVTNRNIVEQKSEINVTVVKMENTTVIIPIENTKKNETTLSQEEDKKEVTNKKEKQNTNSNLLPNIPSLPVLPTVSSIPKAPALPSVPTVTLPVSVEKVNTDTFIKVLEKDDDKLLDTARGHIINSVKIMNDTITQ
ncbi:MAG: Unknown protein [uncultured Sulfurovum sp.]|uniref:Uncharacterized protein n=1 Tax=uncultured Sulfurovum sp. TaxID=269237 RepID=A0A6S6TLL3_9BACT|nr:MAG: Unknown protein [uncultured Sulfurovum sp.]